MQCLGRPGEGVRSPRTRVTESYELSVWVLGIKSSALNCIISLVPPLLYIHKMLCWQPKLSLKVPNSCANPRLNSEPHPQDPSCHVAMILNLRGICVTAGSPADNYTAAGE